MQWAIWDEELQGPSSVMRNLPDNLQGRSINEINDLGFRELISVQPEDYIPRFAELAGSAKFELREDGRVYQTFPDADFSVAAVRKALKDMAANDANKRLGGSDWYITRSIELGTEIPDDVRQLRSMIREHLDWIRQDIDTKGPRELVEYRWNFPNHPEQVMVNGSPVIYTGPALIMGDGTMTRMDPDPAAPVLRQRLEGVPIPEGVPDVADVPVVENPMPHLTATAPIVEDPYPYKTAGALVVPEDDIRRLSQEERDALPPEEFARLMKKEQDRELSEASNA